MHRLAGGAVGLGLSLSRQQLEQFETYYRELVEWNQRVNLTSVTGYEEAQFTHFLDSLTVAVALPPRPRLRVIDVGSGAGFPGLPLKILYPGLEVTLLESAAKKTAFLRHMVEKLRINGVAIITGRAEEIARQPGYREGFDVVLCRAVAPLSTLAELTLPLTALGGRVIAQKKGEVAQEVQRALKAIAVLGGKLTGIKPVEVGELGQRRLVIIEKVSPTPDKYPRRPGMAAKRPIPGTEG